MLIELKAFDSFVDFARTQLSSLLEINSNSILLSTYYTVFDQMFLNDISISLIESNLISSEIQRVSSFNRNSFLKLKDQLTAGRDAIADIIGATDLTYNSIYGRSPLPALLSTSPLDIVSSSVFQTAIVAIDGILANETNLSSAAAIDPFAFARINANNPAIDIASYASGTLVKLNYNETLQALASRTMGSADKWPEIAIANGLKPPYIDEIGQKISLLSNGNGNQIVIAAIGASGILNSERIYVNQLLFVQSNTYRQPDQRTIISIKEVPISGDLIIQLDGSSNLDQYKTSDNASILIFQKNTINSNFFVLIPSDNPLPPTLNKTTPWFLRSSSQDERNAGVDLLLGSGGDLILTPYGDIQLAYGIENAMQAVKILMSTVAGDLSRHPEYGIVNVVGQTNANPGVIQQVLTESIARQILSDTRFSRLDHLTVEYLSKDAVGPSAYKISLGVVLSGGGDTVIPISFGINLPQ
jgi:hypothetical protein